MTKHYRPIGIILTFCGLLLVGCSTNTKDTDEVADHQSQAEQQRMPQDHGADGYGGADSGILMAAGLQFSLPEGWVKESPESQMRAAQLKLPATSAGEEDAELIIFYFGPSGGGDPEETLQRWAHQFVLDESRDPQEAATRKEMNVGDFKIKTLELTGDFQSSGMMTGQPGSLKSDWALLGAVIEGDQGPWFVKGSGPEAVISSHRDACFEFLKSVK
jgi:hypothetical protein